MKIFFQKRIIGKISQSKSLLFCFLLIILTFPFFTSAATLFIDPQDRDVKVGDTFSVSVNTNSQGTSINAASLDIKYDTKLLSVSSVGKGGSIFSIWAEEPTYSNIRGTVHFSGGLSSPGWNGGSGNIIRINFKAKAVGQTKISLSNGSVLANDGVGTDVLNISQGSSINIIKAIPGVAPVIEKITAPAPTTKEVVIAEPVLFPIIENLPDSLNEGDTLSFNGAGISNGQIQIYIQKGKKDVEVIQINTKEDGKFNVIYKNPVTSGYYKIWARNISANGVLSTPSDISYVEVVNSASITVSGFEITYKVLSILLAVLVLILLIFLIMSLNLYERLKSPAQSPKPISVSPSVDVVVKPKRKVKKMEI